MRIKLLTDNFHQRFQQQQLVTFCSERSNIYMVFRANPGFGVYADFEIYRIKGVCSFKNETYKTKIWYRTLEEVHGS
jgi:hypothetical protein